MATSGRARAGRLAAAMVVVVAIGAAIAYRDRLDAAALEAWVGASGAWAPLFFVLAYVAGAVAGLPGLLFTLAAGALFGPVWGSLYALVGATGGATAAFLIARYVASDWVRRRAGARLGRLLGGVEREGWRFVAFVRLVPLFPFNVLNYALGLTRIPLGHYVAASFICMAPAAVAYVYLGFAGRAALAGEEGLIRNGVIALALLATIGFLPRFIRRMRGVRAATEEGASMATKTAVNNPTAPDYTSMFNWGLKLKGFSELFLLAGHAALGKDNAVIRPGDAVGQTRHILADVKRFVEENGYTLNDVIRVEFTMTKDVKPDDYGQIWGLFGEFFGEVKVKPAAGTARVIEALAVPGLLVEYEFWFAK